MKGVPLEMLDTLMSCQPSVAFLLTSFKKEIFSNGSSCARLREKECAWSKVDGPRSACVSNGFWGGACAIAPTVLVADVPATVLVSSMDLEKV